MRSLTRAAALLYPPAFSFLLYRVLARWAFVPTDTALARLGQDIVITLSATLDGVGPLRTTDPATVLTRARALPSPLPVANAQAAAKALGARSVVTGTLVAEGDRVRASVTLHRVEGDSTLARASVVASPKDVAALTDSLTWQLLRQVWQRGSAPSA